MTSCGQIFTAVTREAIKLARSLDEIPRKTASKEKLKLFLDLKSLFKVGI